MNILRPTPIDPYPSNQFFQHIEEEFEKLYARSPLPKIYEDQLNSSSDSAVFKSPPRKNVSKDVSQSQKAKIFLSLKNHNNSESSQSFLSDNSFSLQREKIRQPGNHSNVVQRNTYRELSVSGENNVNNFVDDNQQMLSHDINRSLGRSKDHSDLYEDGRSSISEIDNTDDIERERQNFIVRSNVNLQERTKSPAKAFLALKNSSNNSFNKSDTTQNKENVPAVLNTVTRSSPLKVNNVDDNNSYDYLRKAEMENHVGSNGKFVNNNTEDETETENCNGNEDGESLLDTNESVVEQNKLDFGNGTTGYDGSMELTDENDDEDNNSDVEEENDHSDSDIQHSDTSGQLTGNQSETEAHGQCKKGRKSCRVNITKLTDREIKMSVESTQSEVYSQEVDRIRKSRNTQELEEDNTVDLYNDKKQRKAKQIKLYAWIIRKHEQSDGIYVEGKKRPNNVDLHCSEVVKKRLSPKFIETESGAIYCLIGNIKAASCVKAGFSKEMVKKFKKGFPENWKELVKNHYENNNSRKNSSSRSEEQDASEKEIKKPIKRHSKSKNKDTGSNKSKSTKDQERETEDESEEISNKRSRQVKSTDLHLWIIKKISNLQGICVEGKKSLKDDYFWHSGIVTKRISPKIVETSSGSRYHLIGDIETLDCLDAGFSKEVVKHFKKGFPVNWKELIENQRKPTKRTSEDIRTPVRPSKKDEGDTSVYTPTGQVIQLDTLKKTRSGRIVKPQLAWWRGENFKVDSTNNILEVSYGSKHAEEFHKELAEQYKMSSKRLRTYKRINNRNNTSQNIADKSRNTSSSSKKNNTLSQNSLDNTTTFMADLGNSIDESIDSSLSTDSGVQNVLHASKQNRTKKKNGFRKSFVDGRNKGQVSKVKKSHESKDESYSKSIRKGSERDTKEKNDEGDKGEVDESYDDDDDDDEYVPNTVKKAKTGSRRSKDRKIKRKIDNKDNDSDDNHTNNAGTVKKNRTVSVLRNNNKKTKVNDSLNGELPWHKQEITLLQRAVRQVKKDAPQFWQKVADIVKTRSVEECQKFYYEDIETKPKKGTENKNKGHEEVKLTAKPGTLKRKQQVRDLLDQYNDGYEDDLFDSTPFRSKGKIKIPKIVDESIFDELAKANPDIVRNIKTPTTKLYIEAVSEKKTPASSLIISPFPTIDRKDADRCIRKMQLKRRQLAHHNKTKKFQTQTPVTRTESNVTGNAPISNLFKSASPSEKSLFFQEDSSGDNHDNSDEENDYYWSETEEA